MAYTSFHFRAKKSFTLFYAVLVVSVILMISSGIFTILLKEMKISGLLKESQLAYHAAESGSECALYHLVQGHLPPNTATTISCNGQNISVASDGTFQINFSYSPACAKVKVDFAAGLIRSRGYNTCAPSFLRVERGVELDL